MRGPYTQLYLHLVWATWDRLPLIVPEVEEELYACIASKCRELRCEPIAVGGIEDHVHLLAGFHAAIAPAVIVKEVKGASSHLMTHRLRPDTFFRWQGAYGAFTVNKDGLATVATYIANHKKHHMQHTLVAEWEKCEDTDDAWQKSNA
ncbi:MAG TPA: IS200/IS605 family transposase [Chloroflexia bacterium]|nr:IS200/IS605 family transposase [Chloroflexia bacterium]